MPRGFTLSRASLTMSAPAGSAPSTRAKPAPRCADARRVQGVGDGAYHPRAVERSAGDRAPVPAILANRTAQDAALRAAFVPWLMGIEPATGVAARRAARLLVWLNW
jgi:hypothetical protein